MNDKRKVVLITGVSGGIGTAVADALGDEYRIIGMDLHIDEDARNLAVDLTSEESVKAGLEKVRDRFGERIEAVVHLAAYFDFTGEEHPAYRKVNIEGTRRLLEQLQPFDVGHFIFSSTMLVHRPSEPGITISENDPREARWAYPQSKLETERVIEEHHGDIPYTHLRIAGVYDDNCSLPLLAHQMQRIYERRLKSRFFSGDTAAGQACVHRDDVVDAIVRAVRRREKLAGTPAILIGERNVMSYEELQNRLGELIHGEQWSTHSIPKPIAKAGAWMQDKGEDVVPDAIDKGRKPFIRPFMIAIADDHYELDVSLAKEKLGWAPRHSLADKLPELVERMKRHPAQWYRDNGLVLPAWLSADEVKDSRIEALREKHRALVSDEHFRFLWAHFLTMGMGIWLMTSPPILGYESTPLAASDIATGLLVAVFGALSLSQRMAWARLVNAALGIWLMFAPLAFWAPTAAAYLNGTLVGALVTGFAMLVRPPIGVSVTARMTGPDVPDGWDFSPSSWTQRLPIIALAFVGLYISRYLTAYQLEHIGLAWDPFFGDGTERVITSSVSKAWPVPDAGVGALTYMLEILTGLIGSRRRWRTMPWLVILFGVMIVPLGAVSIFFIVIQPIVIGTWCTLCLIAAAAMLVQIPYSLDELLATGQFLLERKRKGQPLWKVFIHGDTASGGSKAPPTDFRQPARTLVRDILGGGVNLPWTLVASILLGIALMCTRLIFGTEGPQADSDHLIGAMIVTIAVASLAEMARPVRFLNILFGIALMGAPWMFDGGSPLADALGVLAGIALIALSIPRGKVAHRYGNWNRFIV